MSQFATKHGGYLCMGTGQS